MNLLPYITAALWFLPETDEWPKPPNHAARPDVRGSGHKEYKNMRKAYAFRPLHVCAADFIPFFLAGTTHPSHVLSSGRHLTLTYQNPNTMRLKSNGVPCSSMGFSPQDLDMSLSDKELGHLIMMRGYASDGMPDAWGIGFTSWYLGGGDKEVESGYTAITASLRGD